MFDLKLFKQLSQLCFCIILGLCGFGVIVFWPVVLNSCFVLEPNSIVYWFWKKIPNEVATEFYFFNWTNADDFYNLSVKPKFDELGPYKFSQSEEKCNVIWNENGTVTYREKKIWKHQGGNLDDVVVGVNYITLAATTVTRFWKFYTRRYFFLILKPLFRSLFSTHTVSELLFEGYSEPLIKIARALPIFHDLKFPNWDRFGWFYQRNGTTDFAGVVNMGTGINSTLGDLQPEEILTFSPDLRRKFHLHFVGTEMVDNILGYKYVLGDRFFDNGTIFPENSCFCNGECVPYGMVNLSTTRHGFPLFLSLPHFFRADPTYLQPIDGLKPNKNQHESILIIEPTTGIPIEMRAKTQLNLLIRPVNGISLVENVRQIFVPVWWTKQNIKLSGLSILFIKLIINLPIICTSLGSLMIGISFVLMTLFFNRRRRTDAKRIILLKDEEVPLKRV
ncbi:protein croquemort-like [Tribolium castaneum]|uniref:protein croquemort-like n=1 Tax=Tribolium castaneum TaxID=7070 RepID=UPI0030FE7EA5